MALPILSKIKGYLLLLLLGTTLPVYASGNGTATTTGSVIVPVATIVSCTSSQVTVLPGTQTTTLIVDCTLTGNPNSLNSNANSFAYPGTITSGSSTLNVSPVSTVSSPDGSITSISGTYNSFNGTMQTNTSNIWKIRSTCTINTTAITPAGTYSGTVNYNWSTI